MSTFAPLRQQQHETHARISPVKLGLSIKANRGSYGTVRYHRAECNRMRDRVIVTVGVVYDTVEETRSATGLINGARVCAVLWGVFI